eukprot:Sdes_comp16097_c0_seq3m5311
MSSSNHVPPQLQQLVRQFWADQTQHVHTVDDFKNHELPLARIKKIMKTDEDVKMISAEAPVLFAKACELFILELSLKAWFHSEENKRRTLQRNDIAMAISKCDTFDFLIDIVPRDELKAPKKNDEHLRPMVLPPDQLHYYYQLAQMQADPAMMARAMDQIALYQQQQASMQQLQMQQGQLMGQFDPQQFQQFQQPQFLQSHQ